MRTLPGLILSCFYFSLALNVFMAHLRQKAELTGLKTVRDSNRLASIFSLLIRDTVLVYAAILLAFVVNTVLITGERKRVIQEIGLPWIVAVYTLVTSRLTLMLGGDPRKDTGVYKSGVEYRVWDQWKGTFELKRVPGAPLDVGFNSSQNLPFTRSIVVSGDA